MRSRWNRCDKAAKNESSAELDTTVKDKGKDPATIFREVEVRSLCGASYLCTNPAHDSSSSDDLKESETVAF